MYLRVIWDDVNSITATCTWTYIPNTPNYLCTLMYCDVFDVIGSAYLLRSADHRSRRNFRREVPHRTAELHVIRTNAAFACFR